MRGAWRAVVDWLDDRTGVRGARRHLLDEPLPPGTGWWFTLGSVLLFGLTIQIVTGIVLAFYYAPTPDHAWDSIRYITTQVRGGSFLRGLHHWGATVVVVAAIAHLVRVVVFGSYRKPREVNWLVGLALLLIILALGLTGYLLPWDQRAYWATVVSINISRLTPFAGDLVASLLMGGADVGALTLTRWYAIHVLVLPVTMAALVAVHLYLLRRHGISGPVRARAGASQPFFPYQAARDLTMAIAVGALLTALAWKGAPALEPPADPTSSDYIPRPEWYFLGLFQLLKYFPGRLEIIGAMVVPGLVFTFLVLLPWLDRGVDRAWTSRRTVLGLFTAGLAAATTLTILGAMDRPPVRTSTWDVRELAGVALIATSDRCTRCHGPDRVAAPIEPGTISRPADWLAAHVTDPIAIAPGVREAPASNEFEVAALVAALGRIRAEPAPAIDPVTARAVVGFNRECLACHTIDRVGGNQGPNLSTIGRTLDAATIERRILNPFDVQTDATMPPFDGVLSRGSFPAARASRFAAWGRGLGPWVGFRGSRGSGVPGSRGSGAGVLGVRGSAVRFGVLVPGGGFGVLGSGFRVPVPGRRGSRPLQRPRHPGQLGNEDTEAASRPDPGPDPKPPFRFGVHRRTGIRRAMAHLDEEGDDEQSDADDVQGHDQ